MVLVFGLFVGFLSGVVFSLVLDNVKPADPPPTDYK